MGLSGASSLYSKLLENAFRIRKEGIPMRDTGRMDKTFHIIMKGFVETGRAPHYTEIAAELGVSTEGGLGHSCAVEKLDGITLNSI
jgi:hypothetical protein